MSENKELKEVEHHKQHELCLTRPAYRATRKLTAVKVYTVVTESQHLFIYNVPKINLRSELKSLCSRYGQVLSIHVASDYKTEPFSECYHVQFERIQSARIAKRLLDNKPFYGQILHVCYAPEFESIDETRAKFEQRKKDVLRRIAYPDKLPFDQKTLGDNVDVTSITKSQLKRKRKYSEELTVGTISDNNNIEESTLDTEKVPEIPVQCTSGQTYPNSIANSLKDFYSLYEQGSSKNYNTVSKQKEPEEIHSGNDHNPKKKLKIAE